MSDPKKPDLRLPRGLMRFRQLEGSASDLGRRRLEKFSLRDRVPKVTEGWRALGLPGAIAPLVYFAQRLRYSRSGKIALLTMFLAPALVVLSWVEAGFETVEHQVRQVKKQHKTFVARKDTRVLVLGTDDVPTKGSRKVAGRSDTMILLNIQYEKKRIRALSIPRDTFVMVDYGRGFRGDKIAHAFRRGKVGWRASKAAVERLTRLKIDHYATVDYGLFRSIIDAIGGVELTIAKRMHYEDKAGGLFIDFQPGETVLTGQKALEYVRFRKDGRGDVGRIERQQKFLRALVAQLLKVKAWRGLLKSETMRDVLSHLDTDFEIAQLPALAYQFREISPEAFEAKVLPGEHHLRRTEWSGERKLSYFFATREKLDALLDSWFLSKPRPPPTEAERAILARDARAAAGIEAQAEADKAAAEKARLEALAKAEFEARLAGVTAAVAADGVVLDAGDPAAGSVAVPSVAAGVSAAPATARVRVLPPAPPAARVRVLPPATPAAPLRGLPPATPAAPVRGLPPATPASRVPGE